MALFYGQIELDKDIINNFGIGYARDILSISNGLDNALSTSYNHLATIAETFAKRELD